MKRAIAKVALWVAKKILEPLMLWGDNWQKSDRGDFWSHREHPENSFKACRKDGCHNGRKWLTREFAIEACQKRLRTI